MKTCADVQQAGATDSGVLRTPLTTINPAAHWHRVRRRMLSTYRVDHEPARGARNRRKPILPSLVLMSFFICGLNAFGEVRREFP